MSITITQTLYILVSVALSNGNAPVLTKAPELLQYVEATYPEEALEAGIEGAVDMQVDLDATGAVTRVQVVSAPHPSLAQAAMMAVSAMEFSGAEVDGEPSAVRIGYTYNFTLDTAPKPKASLVAELRGVVHRRDGVPVPRALIEVSPGSHWVETDEAGRFSLTVAAPEIYTLTASTPQARATPVELAIEAGEQVELSVKLPLSAPLESESYETVVRAVAPTPEVSHRSLSKEELRSVPGTFGDPLRVVESLPGVGRSPFSSGILVMRGSSPDDSAVMVDGHPIPLLYHFGGGPSVIPPDAIDSLELSTGGFGARYGRATAGIVDVKTRSGRTDALHGGAHVDLLDAGGSIEGPIGEVGAFRLSARRSYIDTLIPLVRKQAKRGSLTLAPVYYDYHGRGDLFLSDDVSLTLAMYGSDDKLTFADERGIKDLPSSIDLHIASHRLNPTLRARLGHGFTAVVSPTVGWWTTGGSTPYSSLDVHTWQVGTRAELINQTESGHRITIGTDFTRDTHVFSAEMPSVPQTRDFPSPAGAGFYQNVAGKLAVQQIGLYGEADLELGDLQLVPGLRLHNADFAGRTHTTVGPRVNARYELLEGLAMKAGTGIYHRVPEPHEIAPHAGNPDLEMERSLQGMAGFEWSFWDIYTLEVQGYVKRMYNLAQHSQRFVLRAGTLEPMQYESIGEGRVKGGEIMLQRKLSRGVMGWVAYSLSHSERRDDGGAWMPYVRDQTHHLSMVLSVDLPWGLRAGSRFRFVTGYPVVPVVNARFDADSGNYLPQTGALGDERLPDFVQLDLRLEKLFGERSATHVIAYADVQNVTNQQNAEFFEYSHDYSERYAYPGLPILPSVGVEARF